MTTTINGTDADNLFDLDDNGPQNDLTLDNRATIEIADATTVTLNGYEGADIFEVDGQNGLTVLNVFGGDGDDDDLLDASSPSGAVTINLEPQTVVGYGPQINYTGLETIEADGDGQTTGVAVKVTATVGDDTVEVTPLDADDGTLQANGADPVVNYSNTDGLGVIVDTLLGEDTLVVNATSANDNNIAIDVSIPSPTVNTGSNGGLVTFNGNTEALTVNGLEGDDIFNVRPGAIPVSIDGGDPIAASDTLIVDANWAGVDVYPGPESDEGGIEVAGTQPISFDHIEDVTIDNAGVATIWGTSDGDEITVSGTDVDSAVVWVNAQAR